MPFQYVIDLEVRTSKSRGLLKKKLLIVEDEEDILELLVQIFISEDNFVIFRAKDGDEALKCVLTENPDIILLDIQLPKLNGYDLCKAVKSNSVTSGIKVLMLSGMTQKSDWQKAWEVGADGYITKPFDPIKLLEKIEELLSR